MLENDLKLRKDKVVVNHRFQQGNNTISTMIKNDSSCLNVDATPHDQREYSDQSNIFLKIFITDICFE